ncbi:MAG: hypothetical protein JO257_19990 [Deltaproteobacteria bacterium]|nr:hypothetical protein [Deltaproteobacteria bacterium]
MGKHVPRWIVGLACALVVVMYACNHDMAGKPDAPRGTGQYLPILDRGDGHMMYLMARSTAIDLDWVFDNDLARFGDPWNEPRTVTGRKSIVQPIGPALVWTPLIWVSDAGAAVVNLFGADIPLHGYTLWTQRFVFLSSALFGCGACLLGAWLARRLALGRWAVTYATVGVLLGTSLTYYATYMPSYAHAMDAAVCAAIIAWWARTLGRTDLRRWIIFGVLLGVAALIRVQDFAFGVLVLVELAFTRDKKLVLGGAVALAVALVVFIPQLVEWYVVFGKAFAVPQGPHYTRFGSPMILELLWAPRNGWLVTTPIAYAGLIGLFLLPREHRLVAAGLLAVVVVQIYLNSTIADWWGSASFGQRRLCSVTLPLVVGNAALLTRLRRAKLAWLQHAAVGLVFGALVVTNLTRVWKLRGGKPAPMELEPTCCHGVPGFVEAAYWRLGNPFELPASAIFAVKHGVPLVTWDRIVGDYPLTPPFGAYRDDALHHIHASWKPPGVNRASDGRVLVPILIPQATKLTVTASGACTLRWDGDDVASDFTVTPSVGTHELACEGGGRIETIELELL